MIAFHGIINDDYGWEITFLHPLRKFSDGVSFLAATIDWDRYEADHCPRFRVHIVVLNLTIIEFCVYCLHHRGE